MLLLLFLCLLTGCFGDEEKMCAADVKKCTDGSFVSRDPENNCEFRPCPPTEDKKEVEKEPNANNTLNKEVESKARKYIEDSATYNFDGYALKHVKTIKGNCDSCYEIHYNFKSNFTGYGNRSNESVELKINEHDVELYVSYGEVRKAVIDGSWNMMKEEMNSPGQIACEEKGGEWMQGNRPQPYCNMLADDAGVECTDSSECEGLCLATLTEKEQEQVLDEEIKRNGKCSKYKTVTGCTYPVNNGKVSGLVCSD